MKEKNILLKQNGGIVELPSFFENSTDGKSCNFKTSVSLSSDKVNLIINFECQDDDFVGQNNMTIHNDPLYNQEVFEVFISPGKNDPAKYLEIEINPNNALWVGRINNPSLGDAMQSLESMVAHEDAGIKHSVEKSSKSWKGTMTIPWALIGADSNGDYRINFYRIRANQSHNDPNWVCDAETCDFVCWNSTLSGDSPAFHRPKRFGLMNVED